LGIIRPLYTFQVFHIQLSWAVCYATGREHQALEKHNAPRWSRPLGCRESLLIFTSYIAHRWGHYRAITKNCQCVLRSTFVVSILTRWNSTDAKRVYCSGGCAALRRLRKRPPISARSGENTTGEVNGFLWRGAPAKGGFGVATPTSSRPGGQMSASEIWATGRYLLSRYLSCYRKYR
jgi:hypothetical protein